MSVWVWQIPSRQRQTETPYKSPFKFACQKSWLHNYYTTYRFFPYADLREYLPRRSFFLFFCKKVLTNDCFYGKIGGAIMIDARCFSILSSFFHFFRSKFQILFIFANSRKVFYIYLPNIGATLVIMRRFSQKSSKKLKKIAQFSNKIFVQFSQKIHRFGTSPR